MTTDSLLPNGQFPTSTRFWGLLIGLLLAAHLYPQTIQDLSAAWPIAFLAVPRERKPDLPEG